MGSPPRMRGKPQHKHSIVRTPGITPAHAGKTQEECRKGHDCGDHPRACGENPHICSNCGLLRGSPPRMRGKPTDVFNTVFQPGITPAHAGKTRRSSRRRKSWRDHPRACGENSRRLFIRRFLQGSPPRMRGKLKKPAEDFKVKGITPAHAGKTDIESIQNAYNGDHPRACGENTPLGGNMITMPGSPPRVRGKRRAADGQARPRGITPACAGKTEWVQ